MKQLELLLLDDDFALSKFICRTAHTGTPKLFKYVVQIFERNAKMIPLLKYLVGYEVNETSTLNGR